jgi:hypothetical protein
LNKIRFSTPTHFVCMNPISSARGGVSKAEP